MPAPRVVAAGVDTLVLSYALDLPAACEARLREWQASATKGREQDASTTRVHVAGEPFEVASSGGRGGFAWRLTHPDMVITISPATSPQGSMIRIEWSSHALWTHSPWVCVQRSRRLADFLAMDDLTGARPDERAADVERVSRIDIATDWQNVEFSGTDDELRRFRCRGTPVRWPDDERPPPTIDPAFVAQRYGRPGGGFSGYWFGTGKSHALFRIYRKDRQAKKCHKEWIVAVWRQLANLRAGAPIGEAGGYVEDEPVWRCELQLRREALAERGIDAYREDMIRPLWLSYVAPAADDGTAAIGEGQGAWISHRDPRADPNASRWPLSRTWAGVQLVQFAGAASPLVKRARAEVDVHHMEAQAKGLLASLAAAMPGSLENDKGALLDVLSHLAASVRLDGDSWIKKARDRREKKFG